jgi:ferritin
MPTPSLLSAESNKTLQSAVASELYASALYKSLSNQLQRLGYFGAQKFFAAESAHELDHYQLIADYMSDMGGMAKIPTVPAPEEKIEGLRDSIEAAFDTELQLMRDYAQWYAECKCEITKQFLLQFIEHQRKSVGEFGDLISRLDRAGTDVCALLMIDTELGAKQ